LSGVKVYLAGPAVFHPAARALFDYLSDVCAEHGCEAVRPVSEQELDGVPAAEQAGFIRARNMEKIAAADAVIACISPFRGAGADAGTAWEMGYAEALGKAVVAWCEETSSYLDRVPHDRDAAGKPWCRQHGMLVEDFGLADNLMLTAGALPVQRDFAEAVKLVAASRG
jgi:nucleoside 2-deoxyribosyltransferase